MKTWMLAHLEKYPKMEIVDAVKLLYQSEFGGGHMIRDAKESLARLYKEYMRLDYTSGREICYDLIGNQLCRLHLPGIANCLSLETVNRFFVNTANDVHSDMASFKEKLDQFVSLCEQGELPFDGDTVRNYLARYEAEGCPVTHHSGTYRQAYHPAYRVISIDYVNYIEVFQWIDRMLKNNPGRTCTVAVDGLCGSGKSYLARLLEGVYSCSVIHMDDFFLRPQQRTEERLSEIGGNVDYERFNEEVLQPLALDQEKFQYQRYDCSRQRLTDMVTVRKKPLCIIEGSYAQHPFFDFKYDLKIFLSMKPDRQIERIRIRNGEYMLKRFVEEWIPMENLYFETFGIREKSDLVYEK